MTSQLGVIYMLHFDQPYKHARHYVGWTDDLLDRLDTHARGHGARLVAVIGTPGSASPWSASARAPAASNAPSRTQAEQVRYCPACTPHPRNGRWSAMPGDFTPRSYLNHAGRR